MAFHVIETTVQADSVQGFKDAARRFMASELALVRYCAQYHRGEETVYRTLCPDARGGEMTFGEFIVAVCDAHAAAIEASSSVRFIRTEEVGA